jgi:hypothetical protein
MFSAPSIVNDEAFASTVALPAYVIIASSAAWYAPTLASLALNDTADTDSWFTVRSAHGLSNVSWARVFVVQQAQPDSAYKGAVTVKSLRFGTYLGILPSGLCVVDRVATRSMEHFRVTDADGGVRLTPLAGSSAVGFDGGRFRLVEDGPPLHIRSLIGLEKALPKRTAPLRIPRQSELLVFATTLPPMSRLSHSRQQLQFAVIAGWLRAASKVAVAICVESEADAVDLRRLGPNVHARSDCETAQVPGGKRLGTYRGVFAMAERLIEDPHRDYVIFSNADISYSPGSFSPVVRRLTALRAKLPIHTAHVFVTGRRSNCDVPGSRSWESGSDADNWLRSLEVRRCVLFGDDAQDYFLVSPNMFRWDAGATAWTHALHPDQIVHGRPFRALVDVPPLVVGSIAFDNWLVSQANKRPDALTVDATPAVTALHLNHGADDRASHHKPSSVYNSRLAHEAGGWSKGKTSVAGYALTVDAFAPRVDSEVAEVNVLDRSVLWCRGYGCTALHENQDLAATDPPDAFARPWERPD